MVSKEKWLRSLDDLRAGEHSSPLRSSVCLTAGDGDNFESAPTIKFFIKSTQRRNFRSVWRVDMVKHFACRDRRPRRSKKQQVLLFTWLPIIAGCNFKILSFPDRRGRRSLQGLRGIGRKSVAANFTVTSILDRRGASRSARLYGFDIF